MPIHSAKHGDFYFGNVTYTYSSMNCQNIIFLLMAILW